MSKRTREANQDEMHNSPGGHTTSLTSKFNAQVLKKLQKELDTDPEVDLISKFPMDYSNHLAKAKGHQEREESWLFANPHLIHAKTNLFSMPDIEPAAPNLPSARTHLHLTSDSDVDSLIPPASAVAIVFPLSHSVQDILGVSKQRVSRLEDQSAIADIRKSLTSVIRTGEVLWQSKACVGHAVIKCSSDVVVKIVPSLEDYTECTSIQYLEENIPEIPAPRHLGLVTVGKMSYIFMSFISGTTLDKIWPQLHEIQKMSISDQLNKLFLKLRQLRRSNDMLLGGVRGEGCKDTRRHTRVSKTPIHDSAGFEDFIFSNPRFGGSVYIAVLRELLVRHTSDYVFTHGDVRPANIMVQHDGDGNYLVTGLLDWEKSGFYPDDFECIKITSTMSASETDDWFLHLPECIAPRTHPAAWLLDRLWDKHVA